MSELQIIKFTELFEPIKRNLWKFILSLTRNKSIAEDVYSQTVLIAFENFEKLKNDKTFLSYLFTLSSRIYYKSKKSNRNLKFENLDSVLEMNDENSNSENILEIKLLKETLNKLPDKIRESVFLHYFMGFSIKEISKIQITTIANVKIRLFRGRKFLIKYINS